MQCSIWYLNWTTFFFCEKIVSVNFVSSCVKFMIYVSKFELVHQCSKFYTHVLSQSICNACSLKILILIFLFKHTTNQNHLKNPQTKFILHFISDEFSFRFTYKTLIKFNLQKQESFAYITAEFSIHFLPREERKLCMFEH